MKIGNVVKFKDNLWDDKKIRGLYGGFFGPPIDENCENKFTVAGINNQGSDEEPDNELLLGGYPWLVYEDEVEVIKESK